MVFCGGHSPGENNCKCFVCPVNMLFFLFMRTRARVPNVPSPKPDSYDSVTFVLLESANLVGLAV